MAAVRIESHANIFFVFAILLGNQIKHRITTGEDFQDLRPSNGFPFGYRRKFKIDTVESYRMTHEHLSFFAFFLRFFLGNGNQTPDLNSDLYRLCGSLHGLDTVWVERQQAASTEQYRHFVNCILTTMQVQTQEGPRPQTWCTVSNWCSVACPKCSLLAIFVGTQAQENIPGGLISPWHTPLDESWRVIVANRLATEA